MNSSASHPTLSRIGHAPRILISSARMCAALSVLLFGIAQADQDSKDPKKGKAGIEAAKPAKENSGNKAKKVFVTGSLIPRTVTRASGALDTPFSVYVIDAQQIQRSGATTVIGVLNSYGLRR